MSQTTAIAKQEPPKQLSPAAQQKQRLDAFMAQIEQRADRIETLLTDSNVDPKLFVETCRRALMRDPELVNCTPASFIQATLNCAADGLLPDGRKAAIVRYKRAAQYVPMYQGLLDIAYRSGNFQSIEAHVVYDGDEFDFALGDKPFIHHKPTLESNSEKIRGAYAVARTTNGGVFREVMSARDLSKVRAISKATNGPNKDWPGEMARKAPIRRLWKFLPRTPAMDRVAEHDDDTYDQAALAANDGPKLAPGFAAAAIAAPEPGEPPAGPEAGTSADLDERLGGDDIPDFDGEDAEFSDLPEHDAQTGEIIDPDDLPVRDDTPPGEAEQPVAAADDLTRAAPSGFKTAAQLLEEQTAFLKTWASDLTDQLRDMDQDALAALVKDPESVDRFTKLGDALPEIAEALNRQIERRQKELAR